MTEMPDTEDALSPPPGSTPSEMFPVLTSAQQARVLRPNLETDGYIVILMMRLRSTRFW